MRKYKNYDYSTILWNKDKPTHWKCQKAKRIFFTQRELNKENLEKNVLSLTLKGVIRNNLDNPIGLSPKNYATYQLVEKNNLVFKLIDLENISTSRVGLVPERGIMSPAYIRFVLKSDLNVKYFFYQYVDWYKRNIFNGLGSGVRQTLSSFDLINMEILIPPREEQDQIVRYLDWQTSKINRLIAAKKDQIKLLDEYKRSLCVYYVTHGVDNKYNRKNSYINWIKDIPINWQVLFLSQVAQEQCILNKGFIERNLLSLSYGRIVSKDINSTEGLLPTNFEHYQIVYQNNIILRLTDLQNDHKSLRTGLSTQKGIITSAYTCLSVKKNILPEFLYLQLHAADLCKVFYGMGGGVRQSIGFKDIRRMLVVVPPLSEQEQIVSTIKKHSLQIENLIKKIENELEYLLEFKNRLISDVVTGQMDVRDIEVPDFERIEDMADESEEPEDEGEEE